MSSMNACSPFQLFLIGSILFGSILFGSILFGSFTTETLPNTCSVVCDVPHSSSCPVRCSSTVIEGPAEGDDVSDDGQKGNAPDAQTINRYSCGSTAAPLSGCHSKWSCGPPALPVAPT